MLLGKQRQQKEEKYFQGNLRGQKIYEAFKECVRKTNGFKDPLQNFNYDNLIAIEVEQLIIDYRHLQRDPIFENEAACKDMIVSKIAYDWIKGESGEELIQRDPSYLYQYILIFGKEKVIEWAQELINKVDHVDSGVYVDNEGVSYNQIVYKKDIKNQKGK